jgi:hypothetical protein
LRIGLPTASDDDCIDVVPHPHDCDGANTIVALREEIRAVTGRIDPDDHLTAGRGNVATDFFGFGANPYDREAATRQDAVNVEEDLDRPTRHHSRQRAAGEWKRQVGGTGCEDDLFGLKVVGLLALGDGQDSVREEPPGDGARPQIDTGIPRFADQGLGKSRRAIRR